MFNRAWLRFAISGAAAGLINGFFGAGGGMVLIPLLIRLSKVEDKQAFSSAIAIILPICLVTITIYWTQEIFPLRESLPYLLGGSVGGLLGGILFKNISAGFLHRLFGALILWGGCRLIWT